MDIDYTVGEVELSYKPKFKNIYKVVSSEDAYKYLLPTYKEGTICYKEYFKVLFLNQASQVLGYTLISEGGITDTTVDVRVILQAALLTNSVAIILAHNHPSGSMKPSRQDIIASQTRENYNKVEGTQFLSWVSLSYSLLLLVNVPLIISELVNPTQN